MDARRRAAEERFPPAMRQQLLHELGSGALMRDALNVVAVTSTTVWERTRWDTDWAEQLVAVLDEHRPAGWSHGHAYHRGCRCTDCRRSAAADHTPRTQLDIDRMIELYQSGLTLDQVGEQMGVLGSTVSKRLRAAGVDRRRSGPAGNSVTDEQILDLRRQGRSVPEIGQLVGMSKHGVYTRLRKMRRNGG